MYNKMDFSKVNDLIEDVCNSNDLMYGIQDLSVYVFPQKWGCTALGFDGLGCRAITTAYTVVITVRDVRAYVYFDGRHAYTVDNPNENFFKDLSLHKMARVREHNKYKKSWTEEAQSLFGEMRDLAEEEEKACQDGLAKISEPTGVYLFDDNKVNLDNYTFSMILGSPGKGIAHHPWDGLKLCECGGSPWMEGKNSGNFEEGEPYRIKCCNCGKHTKYGDIQNTKIEWNSL